MHAISQYRMIMRYADMVIWDACTAMAIWHAGMPSVLVSTHLTETYQPKPKTQSGAGAYQPLDDPQHLKRADADTMKISTRKFVRTCACAGVPNSTASLDVAKNVRQPGGAHSVRMQYICAVPVGYAAERLGRAVQCKCSKIRMQGGEGASMKHCAWVVWCRAGCITIFAARPPGTAGGTCARRISASKPAHACQTCQA